MGKYDFEQVDESFISKLIDNSVGENISLEYKAELPGNKDSDKKEFLADVSAFANKDGGLMIFGIHETEKHLPEKEKRGLGVKDIDFDKEITRLESILQTGIEPRIEVQIKPVSSEGANFVVIRIKKSINPPHKVSFKGSDKFYSRNSNGKYPVSVDELRDLFLISSRLEEKIKQFVNNRVLEIKYENKTKVPIQLQRDGFIAIFFIPINYFSRSDLLPTAVMRDLVNQDKKYGNLFMEPFGGMGHIQINLDGVFSYSSTESYVQMYRNGTIEGFDLKLMNHGGKEKVELTCIQDELVKYTKNILNFYMEMKIDMPVAIFLHLDGLIGKKSPLPKGYNNDRVFDVDSITLPEIIVDNEGRENVGNLLRERLNLLWNGLGHLEES